MSGMLDPVLGNGAVEQLELLQAEWRTLEQRRSQLSQRAATASGSSHFSMSALQSVASARASIGTDIPLAGTELQLAKLEEEKEALRAALSSRSRHAPLVARMDTSAAPMPRRAPSPPKRVVEDSRHRADERERDREREWREKVRAVEEEREHMRIQLDESRERNSMLEKKINDGQREASDIRTELQRAEQAAKHNNDMWTQVTDKQQASLLLLQREKGALALQVDSLKEENDSLKAKHKNMLNNTRDAERAEQESEVVALCKDREYLMSELQALRQHSAVALQQLQGKAEEVRLAVHEASSLRDQVLALTDESFHQKQRMAAADAKMLEAESNMSKILVDSRSTLRKQESACMFAVRTLLTYQVKRRTNTVFRAWMRETAGRRYQRIHVERMRKGGKRMSLYHHITGWKAYKVALFRDRVLVYRKRIIAETKMMCLHLDEWLDLVRKQARYDKLGFGKKSRHMQRLTTFWFDWYNTVTATKFLRKMQIRDDNRRTREAFEHWTILIHAIRHKKQMELLGTRAWMDSVNGEMGTVVKVWRDYVNQRRESLARNEVLNRRYWSHNQRDIFTLWKRQTLEGRKERHILQTIVHRILFKEANATFRRWVEVVRFSKRAERIMSSWVVHSRCSLKLHVIDAWKDHMRTEKSFQRIIYVMRHAETHRCFNTWADVARHFSASLRVMRQKVRFWYENNCFRAWSKHKSFKLWTDKLLPRMLVRSNKDIMTSSFRDWVQELRQNRSMRKVFGKLYLTFLAKAFQAWCGLSSKNLLLSSRLSNVLTRWFFKSVRGCFNDWAHHVHLVEAMRTALGSLSNRGKAIAVKKTFCCWGTWTVRRRVLGRAMRKMMYRTRSRSFVQWTNLHNYKLLLIKHAEKALHRWVWRSVKGAFIDWTLLICSTRKLGKFLRNWLNQLLIWSYDHWHFKASARRKVSMVIIRIHTHRIHKALAIWVELHVELKIQKSKIRRTVNLRKSKSIHRWMEAIFQDKRCEKLLLLWSRTTVAKAWKTWRIMVYENKFLRKCIRAKMHRKFYKSFRQWVIWFDDQKTNTAYVDAICGKLVANTRQTVKTLFIAWVHRHEYEKELCMIRDMSRKRRMLHLWRRILVVEKVFRQRAYRILPHAASHHESLMVRYVACAWRVWARHSRSLKVNLTRSVWRYFRRLIHKTLDVLTYNVEHAKKLLVPKVDIATVHYRQCRKLFVGRLLHLWLQEVRTCREEKLLENRVVAGVKHCEDSHFTATCGNIMRSWTVWTLSKKFFRSKEGMIQKLQIHKRRYLIRGDFHELVNNLRIEKRHRYITSRCNQAHRLRLRARAFANFHLFTAHRRILRSVLARKVRLYKSKLLRCWQQMGGVVNLEMTFDKQKIKAYRLCVKQRSKRGAMRFLHQWVMFLEQRRIWNKFYSRMARRRLSQMLHAWRTCLVSERVFVRAMQSCETKWLRNRLHEWRRNMDKSKLNHDVKIIYMREIQVRVVVRGWARITTKRKYKYELLNRVLKRRRRVLQQLVWKVWTGTEHKERLMKLAVQSMLHTVRTCFAYWRQGALLIPGISVSHTLDRLPHRSLLAFVLKQWRKYARKIKAAMFKIHPQFRLMKVWNSWQGRRRKLLTARCITDSIRSTVRALYLSSVMRQWLYAVTVPASDAEEAVRNKINRNVVNKFFLKLSEFIHWSKEVTKIAVAAGCTKVTKVAFNAFRGIVAHSIDMRAKSQCAIKQYELFLLADFFYDIRDDVLEGLLLDEGVQDIVKAKTYTTYLMVGFDAFYVLLEELRGFSSRAEGFRHQQDMVLNSDLLAEGFQALKDEYQSILSSNELIDKKYKDRNHAAFKLRTFGDFCCAVENQQRQYDEAEQSIRTKYFHSLKGEAFAVLFVEAQSEKEVEKTARIHFEINFKKRARHMVIYTLKHWITFSKKLEEVMFRKHEIFLMRGGFNELMWATQESVDPGLLKQMLRVRLHKNLKKTFSAFVARLKRRQLLYQVQAKVRQNVKKQSAKMHWCLWRDSFLTRKRRNLALRDIFYRRQCRLCRRALLEWCAVWWQQVYIGSKLVLLRKRFLLLHILTPAMMRWKQFRQNMARLLLAYFRILRTRTIRRATRMLWVWRSFIIDRTRTLRAIEGMMIRRRCNTFRKVLQVWHHSIDRRNQAGGISNSHNHALCRKLLQGWRSSCVEQQGVKERARTYFVIIKSLKIRSTRDLMCRGFIAFAENLFGSRSVASSFYRKVKWQHMRAAHSSLLQRAFVTWRRHWIEFEHLGEALRRVLSQRRSKVDLHHPFWAWVRYIEDKLNIRRETALVHKTSKLLSDVLDVYGEPLVSDFSIRCERAYTIDDLIKLLKKFHQHHSDLKVSAKLQGAAPPRVVSYGPIPYSHYVTTIGKQSSNQMLHHPGLSPAPGLITPNLNQPEDLLNFPGFTGTLERKRSLKSDYTDYPPGVVIPEKYLGSSKEKHDNPKPASQSINRSLELSILKS